jgi:transcriptional regulator
VPTWNYVAIEARGKANRLDVEQLAVLLFDLSGQQEARLSGKVPWTVDKVPLERRRALMRAIVGFSVAFDLLEGKFKLSQDKAQQDAEGVIEALEAQPDPAPHLVASAMRASRKG